MGVKITMDFKLWCINHINCTTQAQTAENDTSLA